ncbi:hypothetical protein ACFQ1E_09815 [Sphingomonas canadensis]|uniref:Uncharacterized protein n=1 Tax=Sphingomonas canadensis TaxID=1219257 RepID=A0ABW3H5X0_9SPHN|nr:hypothetical protein [Sphingomonas canadensis]MCW3836585.1 hypothetical protein [Sphingomonas canadensis]
MRPVPIAAAALLLCGSAAPALQSAPAQRQPCPEPQAGRYAFAGGAIGLRSALQVNPDGAAASYTPGDHGQTYVFNGMNRIGPDGRKIACHTAANKWDCRNRFLLAEARGFAPGTDRFCVYAFEVDAYAPGVPRERCEGSSYRYVVGDGVGKPRAGRRVRDVSGAMTGTYLSTTALRNLVDGRAAYIDSSAIPASVVPGAQSGLLGSVVWVRYRGRSAFAIAGDTGPAFGEGSVALHQLLREGAIRAVQPVGPIPLALRCTTVETGLPAPFVSRPDLGTEDRCRPGYEPLGPADIRAYSGIGYDPALPSGPGNLGVEMIVLPDARLPRQGNVVQVALTPERIEQAARAAGYDDVRLARMAACIR